MHYRYRTCNARVLRPPLPLRRSSGSAHARHSPPPPPLTAHRARRAAPAIHPYARHTRARKEQKRTRRRASWPSSGILARAAPVPRCPLNAHRKLSRLCSFVCCLLLPGFLVRPCSMLDAMPHRSINAPRPKPQQHQHRVVGGKAACRISLRLQGSSFVGRESAGTNLGMRDDEKVYTFVHAPPQCGVRGAMMMVKGRAYFRHARPWLDLPLSDRAPPQRGGNGNDSIPGYRACWASGETVDSRPCSPLLNFGRSHNFTSSTGAGNPVAPPHPSERGPALS
jgi:hypothetical protein